jgi:hypothetical protein
MESIKNNIWKKLLLLACFITGVQFSSMAQGIPGVYVYPEKNQSQEQQSKDENNCFSSAQQKVAENPTQLEENRQHKTLKRTGAGAGIGAILGGGKGAAIGAGAGAISGRRSKNRDNKEADYAAESDIRNAYSACLRSKGYSVE